jgi:hypothetical protein
VAIHYAKVVIIIVTRIEPLGKGVERAHPNYASM